MNQIKTVYNIKNKNKQTLDILDLLKTDLCLLRTMQEIELKRYKEDPYLPNHGFVICNNSEKLSAVVKEIIPSNAYLNSFLILHLVLPLALS